MESNSYRRSQKSNHICIVRTNLCEMAPY